MRERIALAAGIALACVSSASLAADIPTDVSVPVPQEIASRFYVSFHGGYVLSSVTNDVATDCCNTFVSVGHSDPGFRVGGALGGAINEYFSLEGEVSYAQADASHWFAISPIAGGPFPMTGSGSSITGMVNAFLGYNVGSIRPYVGAGIGVAYFTAHNIAAGGAVLNGSDAGFAAQGMIGVDFALTQDTTLGARYRYVYLDNLSLPDGGFTHSFNIATQSVDVVLTHTFD
jgi:opacity protein-like surface antigen